jgi:hypothetical protein
MSSPLLSSTLNGKWGGGQVYAPAALYPGKEPQLFGPESITIPTELFWIMFQNY